MAEEAEHLEERSGEVGELRHLLVHEAELGDKGRWWSCAGEAIYVLGIWVPAVAVLVGSCFPLVSYSNMSTSWLLTSWGSCSVRGVRPPIPRHLADCTLGAGELYHHSGSLIQSVMVVE